MNLERIRIKVSIDGGPELTLSVQEHDPADHTSVGAGADWYSIFMASPATLLFLRQENYSEFRDRQLRDAACSGLWQMLQRLVFTKGSPSALVPPVVALPPAADPPEGCSSCGRLIGKKCWRHR